MKAGDVIEVRESGPSCIKVSQVQVLEIQDQTASGKWRIRLARLVSVEKLM